MEKTKIDTGEATDHVYQCIYTIIKRCLDGDAKCGVVTYTQGDDLPEAHWASDPSAFQGWPGIVWESLSGDWSECIEFAEEADCADPRDGITYDEFCDYPDNCSPGVTDWILEEIAEIADGQFEAMRITIGDRICEIDSRE